MESTNCISFFWLDRRLSQISRTLHKDELLFKSATVMTDLVEIHFSDCCLLFANDWFLVVAGNIVENNSILVNILKYSQTSFSSFSVVWLGSSISMITKSIVKLQNHLHLYLALVLESWKSNRYSTYPPVLDQKRISRMFWDLPLPQFTRPPLWSTLPPVQK